MTAVRHVTVELTQRVNRNGHVSDLVLQRNVKNVCIFVLIIYLFVCLFVEITPVRGVHHICVLLIYQC